MFRHAWKNKKMTEHLNYDYIWEVGWENFPFLHCTFMFHTFLNCLNFFNHKCVLFCNQRERSTGREGEGGRRRQEGGQGGKGREGDKWSLSPAFCHPSWNQPGRSDHYRVKGSGARAFPLSLSTPRRGGTLASHVFVRIK